MFEGDKFMKKNYFIFEEVKDKFKEYRELKVSNITDDEYDLFCGELIVLPKEIIDRIYTEIYFVLLSADPKDGSPACYVPLKELIDEGRKGIIVLTPFIFASFVHKKSGKELKADNMDNPRILHEVAHHYLKHFEYENEEERKEIDEAADEQVEKWVNQFLNYRGE